MVTMLLARTYLKMLSLGGVGRYNLIKSKKGRDVTVS